ncbi:mannonate dehydratase [Saccharopolyspora sp. K220]|uniref:mannonate dehydratase n=1 Tax=Saccharopolyspora soli TaxID=2926618 RepID=UPI001F59212D|nr:mannonate dehydratase [Saccharopolyspora soli]MCI2423221.1 mannonate dehydratase [Saccharopolyspora soli]
MGSTRRQFVTGTASVAALSAIGATEAANASAPTDLPYPDVNWPDDVREGPDTPKLCQWFSRNPDEKTVRRWRQAGVTGALVTDTPPLPWGIDTLRADRTRLEALGLHVTAYLISGPESAILGTEDRDRDIDDIKRSLVAAGKAGIPVVEYNWYVHRLTEGYYELIDEDDRLGAGYTAFDYDREIDGVPVKDLPREPGTPEFSYDQLWEHYEHFLREVIPVAHEAGVRMALHPNDPPAPISRGNPQILGSVRDWKRMVETVDSPSNGMTVHSGVATEVGADAVDFVRYMGERDRINHIHYRNVLVDAPRLKYAEVFPDNGQTDMFAFMRELVRQGYHRGILPEHPRALDYDREHDEITGQYAKVGGGGHAGELYDTGYCRAMLQAALIAEGKAGR